LQVLTAANLKMTAIWNIVSVTANRHNNEVRTSETSVFNKTTRGYVREEQRCVSLKLPIDLDNRKSPLNFVCLFSLF
jgi:hypothetical protein